MPGINTRGLLPVGAAVCTLMASTSLAQYNDNFEALTGSSSGTIITGQAGWYIPVADSQDGLVYTYAGNPLGIPAHPTGGGSQFVGTTGGDPGLPVPFVRSQKDISFAGEAFRISYDVCITFVGTLPTTNNVGSFSTRTAPGDTSGHIELIAWTDINTAENWDAAMVWYDETGAQVTELPDGLGGLAINRWYRRSTVVGYDSNRILELSVTDLTTGEVITVNPVDRYAVGGPGTGTIPTGFRFFAGSLTVAGNTIAWDNLSIESVPSTGSCCLPLDGSCLDGVTRENCEDDNNGVFNGIFTECATTTCYQLGPDGWVVNAPIVWPGNTCDDGDDCDLSASNDEQWEVTIPYDQTWTISVCNADFDTTLHLGSVGCTDDLGFSDDDCGVQSILNVPLTAGTYYVTLESFSSGCGDFQLAITAPCPAIPVGPGETDETEACGDDTNGGCNADPPIFEAIDCDTIVRGTVFWDGTTRDTDWYELIVTETTNVTITADAEFSGATFGFLDTGGSGNCDDAGGISPFAISDRCAGENAVIESELTPGTWWIFAAASFDSPLVSCDDFGHDYVMEIDCGGCSLPEDLSGNGEVDFADILAVLAAWGDTGTPPEDISGNGVVDFADILAVLAAWGNTCP